MNSRFYLAGNDKQVIKYCNCNVTKSKTEIQPSIHTPMVLNISTMLSSTYMETADTGLL